MDKSEDQIELLIDKPKAVEVKRKLQCKYHRDTSDADFIDITMGNGRIIKRCVHCERVRQDNKKIYHQEWLHEKENLTDYYIRRSFVMGKGPKLKMQEYPDIMIEAKRAVLQLKRRADQLKEPIKNCRNHGDLFIEDVIKAGKTRAGTPQYKCRQCMSDFHARHYALHKADLLLKQQQYRNANPERVRTIKRKSHLKNQLKNQPTNQPQRLYNMQIRLQALERLAARYRIRDQYEENSNEQTDD